MKTFIRLETIRHRHLACRSCPRLLIAGSVVVGLLVWRRRRRRRRDETLRRSASAITSQLEAGGVLIMPADSAGYISVSAATTDKLVSSAGASMQKSISRSASMDELNGWQVDYQDLKVDHELGRGNFGVVSLATWRLATVVVKEVQGVQSDDRAMAQFRREAGIMKKLRPHPNVVALLGVCLDPPCIVSEYVESGALHDLLLDPNRTGRHRSAPCADLRTSLSIFRDVSSGTAHLHAEGLLHCDLAARNLLVSKRVGDGILTKIADCGLSHLVETKENCKVHC